MYGCSAYYCSPAGNKALPLSGDHVNHVKQKLTHSINTLETHTYYIEWFIVYNSIPLLVTRPCLG